MQNIIIFCEAPAIVQYALSIYDKYKGQFRISIFVVNVEGMYKFLSSLNLNLHQLVFIPYREDFSYKNPIIVINEKKRINDLYKRYFEDLNNSKVYFFTHFWDWITLSLAARLSQKNTIYFVDHYDPSDNNFSVYNNSVKKQTQLLILQYMTGIRFRFLKFRRGAILELPYKKYGIKRIEPENINEEIYKRYSFLVESIKKRSILLFESNPSEDGIYVNYLEKLLGIVQRLKEANFNIYLKPHPRTGYSKFLENYVTDILPNYIPGEFLNVDSFLAVVGAETTAITLFARNDVKPSFSILDLFEFESKPKKDYFRDYLIQLSDGKIRFINSTEKLIESLNSVK